MTNEGESVDWYEGNDPEINFNEMNMLNSIQRYGANATNANIDLTDIKPSFAFNNLKPDYDLNHNTIPLSVKDTNVPSVNEENPILKFKRIKEEIDLIEKDVKFYKDNPQHFKSKYSYPSAMKELTNLKNVTSFITNSDNYKILDQLKEEKIDKEHVHFLNKEMHSKLNEHLLNKIKLVNKLKAKGVESYNNVQYELYLTPDTTKVKQFTKLTELNKILKNIEKKIGEWDVKTKKNSISEVVTNMKKHLRLFDKEYQKEIRTKMDSITTKLKEIEEEGEEFHSSINKPKIEELLRLFGSSKSVEELIFKSVSKIESLRDSHEEAAYISIKVKQLADQQDKISQSIDESEEILSLLKENIKQNVEQMRANLRLIKSKL